MNFAIKGFSRRIYRGIIFRKNKKNDESMKDYHIEKETV